MSFLLLFLKRKRKHKLSKVNQILSISSQCIKFGEKPKGISTEAAKQMALDFVEQNNLVKGTVIKDAAAYDVKKAVFVKVQLDNGINAQVVVSRCKLDKRASKLKGISKST